MTRRSHAAATRGGDRSDDRPRPDHPPRLARRRPPAVRSRPPAAWRSGRSSARDRALSWTPMSSSSRRRASGWPRWCGRRGCCGAEQARVWSRATLLELGCGWERGRVIIPIRDRDGELRGVLRYAPSHDHAPKVLAARGTPAGADPPPLPESSTWVVLVEGPPDMISARSRGLPAIAVPGDDAWEPRVGAAARRSIRVGGARLRPRRPGGGGADRGRPEGRLACAAASSTSPAPGRMAMT